jgi:hypothetical protein
MFSEMDVISTYTRQQAIEDGVLVDLSRLFPQECKLYKFPVACTASVFALAETAANFGSMHATIWDLIFMSQSGIVKRLGESGVLFRVILGGKTHTFQCICGPGDSLEPVLTIMMENED